MGQTYSSTDDIGASGHDYSICGIVVVAPKSGDASLVELRHLPKEARIIGTGRTLEELEANAVPLHMGNIILNVSGNRDTLGPIIQAMPNLTWIHSTTAGVEHLLCADIMENPNITLTNARGVFSSSLAEYVIGACLYFAKQFKKLELNKQNKIWDRFPVGELRGKTMGIIGCGDIGYHCARAAKFFGMTVLAVRRRPELSEGDEAIDECFGTDEIPTVMSESDYVVIATPLTKATVGLIGKQELAVCKEGQVLINISRGAVLDEVALLHALLAGGRLKGAVLDVFCTEPLPKSSPFWDVPNLLLSPHNADMTVNFRHLSIKHFTLNCHRFVGGEDLESIVNKECGY